VKNGSPQKMIKPVACAAVCNSIFSTINNSHNNVLHLKSTDKQNKSLKVFFFILHSLNFLYVNNMRQFSEKLKKVVTENNPRKQPWRDKQIQFLFGQWRWESFLRVMSILISYFLVHCKEVLSYLSFTLLTNKHDDLPISYNCLTHLNISNLKK